MAEISPVLGDDPEGWSGHDGVVRDASRLICAALDHSQRSLSRSLFLLRLA